MDILSMLLGAIIGVVVYRYYEKNHAKVKKSIKTDNTSCDDNTMKGD